MRRLSTTYDQAKSNPEFWGRLVESCVGAHLINQANTLGMKVMYWRENNKEVDFILAFDKKIVAIEVKSVAAKEMQVGIDQFTAQYKTIASLVIGGQNLSLEQFLTTPLTDWFN